MKLYHYDSAGNKHLVAENVPSTSAALMQIIEHKKKMFAYVSGKIEIIEDDTCFAFKDNKDGKMEYILEK